MSDPMTNVQIEDVLSSIRRLVAEGDRSRKTTETVKNITKSTTDTAQPSERLVLTKALRVDETEPDSDERESIEPSLQTKIEIAKSAPQDEWEPEGEEVPFAASQVSSAANDTKAPVEIVFDDDALLEDTAAPEIVQFDREKLSQDTTPLRAMTLPPIPEMERDVPLYEDSLQHTDESDPNIDEALHSDTSAANEPEPPQYDVGVDIDEDTLQMLVADIIREELQGALGEQISRNIRRLVRREIHRTLAARDFT